MRQEFNVSGTAPELKMFKNKECLGTVFEGTHQELQFLN
jgi:hypothetical protein